MALNSEKLTEPTSREQRKKIRTEQKAERLSKSRDEAKNIRIRLIPVWAKFLIVLFLVFLFFIIGTMIGYGVIGEGNPWDALKKSTWDHIFDLVNVGK